MQSQDTSGAEATALRIAHEIVSGNPSSYSDPKDKDVARRRAQVTAEVAGILLAGVRRSPPNPPAHPGVPGFSP